MRILYHIPSLYVVTAAPYYYGYKNAFTDLGHEFKPLTADDNQMELFGDYAPDIFITSLSPLNLKYLDLEILKEQKKRGLRVFVNTPFWKSPVSKLRINENPSLSGNEAGVALIKSGNYGDVYYNICEPNDPRMEGFEKVTGYKRHTVLLAADKTIPDQEFSEKYKADISFVGSYLPGRREFMKKHVFPLRKKYDLKLYMNDLNVPDRGIGFIAKVGQYFNVPYLRSLKKNRVTLEEAKSIFVSTLVSINFHEDYQREFGNDFNDRTFTIPISGGFQVCDDVESIRKYLKDGEEIIIAKDTKDWFEKIDYYIRNPEKRQPIIEAGKRRVLNEYTYHNRVNQLIELYNSVK